MANNGILISTKGVRTMAKITNSRTRKYDYDSNYRKEHLEQVSFTVPKGTKEKIKTAAQAEGLTVAEYIRSKLDL